MATKLKNVKLTSVDFVENGANQDAHFKLLKSRGNLSEQKTLGQLLKALMKGELASGNTEPEQSQATKLKQAMEDESQMYLDILGESVTNIFSDEKSDTRKKCQMVENSIRQFGRVMMDAMEIWQESENSAIDQDDYQVKSQEEGEEEMIDKNKLTEEEREQYEALTAKATVEQEPAEEEETDWDEETEQDFRSRSKKPDNRKKKVNRALKAEMESLKKNMAVMEEKAEKNQLREIAKKYAPLGKREDELVDTLYTMKKSKNGVLEEYIGIMDQNLELVNRSGLFSEIGKSGQAGTYTGTDLRSKIEAEAKEIRKLNPGISQYEAMEKAWEQHPELAEAYEKAYAERRK